MCPTDRKGSDMPFCTTCGTKNNETDAFCGGCGTDQLAGVRQPVAAAEPVVATSHPSTKPFALKKSLNNALIYGAILPGLHLAIHLCTGRPVFGFVAPVAQCHNGWSKIVCSDLHWLDDQFPIANLVTYIGLIVVFIFWDWRVSVSKPTDAVTTS